MKKTVLRYSAFAMLSILVLSVIDLVVAKSAGYAVQEIIGYLTMLISMIFVFLGIRHYKKEVNHGQLNFGKGMQVGILITIIPAIFFGLFDLLYTEVINPTWKETYYNTYVDRIKQTVPADQLQAKLASVAAEREMFANPFYQFLLMASTVLIIGIIVTIISSLALRTRNQRTTVNA